MNTKLLLFALSTFFATPLFAGNYLPPSCPKIVMSGSNLSCYGLTNGSASVQVTAGGSGNYTYTWATIPTPTITSGGTSSSLSNLPAGTYAVSVRDNVSGCTVVGAYVVNSPGILEITGTVNDVNCFNQVTGDINATISGGTAPYSYSWSNGATTQDLNNVVAGSYTLTVNAPIGCSATRTFTITQPAEGLDASAAVTNVKCFNTLTGAIDLTVWGGTPPYFYAWNTGQSSQDVTNLPSGNINVVISDSKGCTFPMAFNITSPTQLSGSFTLNQPVLCFGDATGSLAYQAVGATAPYTYSWQNSTTLFAESSGNLNNVVADNYQVTVTDARGCQFTDNAIVTTPTLLTGSTTGVNVSCFGGSDGSINATITGGVAPYSSVWTNGIPATVGTTEDLNSIPAESYTATILDFNNCPLTLYHTITQPNSPIAVIPSVTDVLCFGDNTGAIDLAVTGGTAPYTFAWSSGQTTEDIQNLLAGNYTFNILDFNNCPFSSTEVISQPFQPLTVTNTITDVVCFGESNGGIDLTVTGGTAPYTYEWNNSYYQLSNTNQDLVNYVAETYASLVTDANGCIFADTLTIDQPTELLTSVIGVNILCYGGNNGSVDLTPTGGTIPYVFAWNSGPNSEDIGSLYAGYYEVLVTDGNGCTAMDSITLTQPMDSLQFTFDVLDVRCNNGEDGEIDLSITGGTVPYNYSWSSGDTTAQIDGLTAGYYEFIIVDANACLLVDSIFVDQPEPLLLNETITDVTCFDFSDGIIDISPTGGTLPYNFTWYNSQFALSTQTEDLVDFPADVYQLEIIDSNECFYEVFFNLPEPELLVIDYTYNVVSCAGGSDANILVDITGGNPSYTTTWSNGVTSEDLLNTIAGVYELIVVDQKNCTDSITVDIQQPDSIKVSFSIDEVTCIDQHNGVAYASPYGGNGGYYYEWSNGETSSMNDGLSEETYSLIVTDLLGCIGEDSVFITKNTIGCIDPVNAFTPNGDFYNDTWIIDNMYLYPNAEMQIFNKWGNLIHVQTGIYEPWDGTVKGNPLPSEVYYFVLNLNKDGREPLKGNITIVR